MLIVHVMTIQQIGNMKEDSLLESLSNYSYQANPLHIDFFNDSSPALGAHGELELKLKQQNFQQQQVDLNCLAGVSQYEPPSPKHNGLLLPYWSGFNHQHQQNSQLQNQYMIQCQPTEPPNPISPTPQTPPNPQTPPSGPSPVRCRCHSSPQIPTTQGGTKPQGLQSVSQNQQIGTIIKNETKNIPKNYGKAIITYIEKQRQQFQPILNQYGILYEELLAELTRKKKYINTIANLRELWVDFKFAKCMRVLSNQFLRKYALQYIFNSRICNYTSHVKYRKRLQEAIQTPGAFRHIKQY